MSIGTCQGVNPACVSFLKLVSVTRGISRTPELIQSQFGALQASLRVAHRLLSVAHIKLHNKVASFYFISDVAINFHDPAACLKSEIDCVCCFNFAGYAYCLGTRTKFGFYQFNRLAIGANDEPGADS